MEQTIYKHTIFININNRVVRHIVDDMVLNKDEINPINTDQQYTVTFSKSSDMFRIVYY